MSIKDAIYQVDNGVDFDEIHFKTKAAQVVIEDTGNLFDSPTVEGALGELFQYASNGKDLIATAITGRGTQASGSESFDSLANKIEILSYVAPSWALLPNNYQVSININMDFALKTITYKNFIFSISFNAKIWKSLNIDTGEVLDLSSRLTSISTASREVGIQGDLLVAIGFGVPAVIYDLVLNTWTTKTVSLPSYNVEAILNVEGVLYCFCNNADTGLRYKYNPLLDTYTSVTGYAIYGGSYKYWKNGLVAFTGYTNGSVTSYGSKMYIYDTILNTTTQMGYITNMTTGNRSYNYRSALIGDKYYYRSDNDTTSYPLGVYDLLTNTSVLLPNSLGFNGIIDLKGKWLLSNNLIYVL